MKWGLIYKKSNNWSTSQLIKISTSTWGAIFSKARQVYTTVICPAMTYGLVVWHTSKNVKKSNSIEKLAVLQNKCLQTIAGAFKATSISVLEAKMFIAFIGIHLDQLQTKAQYWLRVNCQSKFLAKTSTSIANKLCGKTKRKRVQKQNLGILKHRSILVNAFIVSFSNLPPPWSDVPSICCDKLRVARAF